MSWKSCTPARVTIGVVVLAPLLLGLLAVGSTDGLAFPPPGRTPYRLPWPAGESHLCTQGNRTLLSHKGVHSTAWDFAMLPGSTICAARSGVVTEVTTSVRWPGPFEGNRVRIRHEDGTSAIYAHLQFGGARVKSGQQVAQGDPIGRSGMTGRALFPHLHFQVRGPDDTPLPSSFADLEENGGVPRAWHSYGDSRRTGYAASR